MKSFRQNTDRVSNPNHFKNVLTKGFLVSFKYVLSHHDQKDYHRCYCFNIGSNKIYLCARCLGIYIGIILGFIIYFLEFINEKFYLPFLIIAPLFTFIEWASVSFANYKSNNFLRTFLGIFLGVAYAFGLILFFVKFPNIQITLIGFIYALAAIVLIYAKNKINKQKN